MWFPVNDNLPSSIKAPIKLALFAIINFLLSISGCISLAFFIIIPSLIVYVSIANISSNLYFDVIFVFIPVDFTVLVLYSNFKLLVSIKFINLLNILWYANGIE